MYPVDVTAGITDWQMLGNGPDPTCTTDPNGVGDCTFAGRQHYRMAKAAAVPETETWESSNALVAEYLAYDHGKDQGANIADLLLYWYKAGTILAFAPVDHTNPAEVDAAMAAFHGAYVGVNLTDDAEQLFEQQQPWTTANGEQPDPSDGHCIVKVKADGSQYDGWVTWGAVQESTLQWTAACLDEAWVIIARRTQPQETSTWRRCAPTSTRSKVKADDQLRLTPEGRCPRSGPTSSPGCHGVREHIVPALINP